MKNKLLLAFAMVLCLGLTFAVYAVRSNNSAAAAAQSGKNSCGMANCCKDGHCAMGGSCCKSGDNCPLKDKAKTENTAAAEVDYSKITFSAADGKDCCAPGASCCQGGACCQGKRS